MIRWDRPGRYTVAEKVNDSFGSGTMTQASLGAGQKRSAGHGRLYELTSGS